MKKFLLILFVVLALSLPLLSQSPASARTNEPKVTIANTAYEDWTPWWPTSEIGLDLSYAIVQRNYDDDGNAMWTWRFKNSSWSKNLKSMEFKVQDKDGWRTDYLPGKLKSGETVGGWAAFSAVSSPYRKPEIRIVDAEWENAY